MNLILPGAARTSYGQKVYDYFPDELVTVQYRLSLGQSKLAEYVQYVDINKDGWLDRIFIAQGYVKGNTADMLMVAEGQSDMTFKEPAIWGYIIECVSKI